MIVKKLIVLSILSILLGNYVLAYDFSAVCRTEQTLYYTITSDVEPYTVEVTSENTDDPYYTTYPTGDLEIPETVLYNSITYSVTSIGDYAFSGCSELTSVTILESVTSIGNYAFDGCSALMNITCRSENPPIITSTTFSSYDGITLHVPVDYLDAYRSAQFWSNFTNIEPLPYETTWTDDNGMTWSFTVNGTEATYIKPAMTDRHYIYGDPNHPEQVPVTLPGWDGAAGRFGDINGLYFPTISDEVYFGHRTLIFEIIAAEDGSETRVMNGWWTEIYAQNVPISVGLWKLPITEAIANDCAQGGLAHDLLIMLTIGTVTIKSVYYETTSVLDVVAIPTNVYVGSTELTVTSIDDGAFTGCSNMTSVTIPEGVTNIGIYAFSNCGGLTEVTIPNSVTNIGDGAFASCSSLETINVESGNTIYDSRDDCNAIIETATDSLITGCKNTIIPSSVTSIGEGAFYGCSGLMEVTIPSSVTNIGDYAFSGCSGLTELTIGNSVTSIGDYAFWGCSGLESIIVESENTKYDSRDNCNAIIETATNTLIVGCKNTIIPSSVTSINDYAFRNCNGLTEVTIPNSVTSIGNYSYAFFGCSGLESITVESGNTKYDSRDNCNAIIETASNSLIAGCKNTIIPSSVTSINDYAFLNCSGLTEVIIPDSVTSIGDYAFRNCSELTDITIPDSVRNIGYYAFDKCDNLKKITIYATTPPTIYDNSFSDTTYQTANLWVPATAFETYRNDSYWGLFRKIRKLPYWSCDFEGDEIWTIGNDQQDGNVQWQITTPETYPSTLISGDNAYLTPFVFNGDTLNITPEHWALADLISQLTDFGGPGQVAESSWIEFSNINLTDAENPQITFRQIFKQLNGVETSIKVSTDGGQTWTDHIVNEEVESNAYGEYEISTRIYEAAGEENVTIRFLFNSDAHTTQMGYGWEIDDIKIKEAPDTITATAGEGGTISPSGDVQVDDGDDAAFTITPNDGYRIASVMVDETENVTDQLVNGVYTFENVTENHTIAATFEEKPLYTITVLSNNEAYGTVSEGGIFEEGTEIMFVATPYEGYRFVSWDDGNTENPRTITVTSDSTFVANFRDINVIWSCDFEGDVEYTLTKEDGTANDWQLITEATYPSTTMDSTQTSYYFRPMNYSGLSGVQIEPYQISETPEHWLLMDLITPSQLFVDNNELSADASVVFSDIDLSECNHPYITFLQVYRVLNQAAMPMKVSTSIDGGSTWTDHFVNNGSYQAYEYVKEKVDIYIPEVGGQSNVTIKINVKNEAGIYSQDEYPVNYGWQIDDIKILEAPAFDLTIADVRMNDGRCDEYLNIEHAGENISYYQNSPMFGQTPRSEWTSPNKFASFNVAVENRGYEAATPIVHISVTSPSGVEIWNVDFTGEELEIFQCDTIDVIEYLDENQINKVFRFTEEQMQNIEIGEYIVTYSISIAENEDQDLDGNVRSHPFYITGSGYCPATPNITTTCGPNTFRNFADNDEILASFTYYNIPQGDVPLYVYITENSTIGTSIQANIYNYNGELTNSSERYWIDEYNLGRWVEIPFNEPITISDYDEGESYKTIIVGIAFYEEGLGTLSLGASNDMPNKGWICRYKNITYGDVISVLNSTSETAAPAICLGVPLFLSGYTITALANNNNYGYVTGSGTYEEGTEITLTAMPYEGYRFVQWDDGNTENPRTITVTSDATYIAIFEAEQAQQYTITVLSSNDAYGSVSGGGTYNDGDIATIMAMPNGGYLFDSWEDDIFDNPRTITVTSDSTFIADFVKCEITQAIDTVVPNFVTVGEHTFYSTGRYSFEIQYETECDTIYDINLTVLAEPVYDIAPNPTSKMLNINSDGFISCVEFYSPTGQLVMRKEVNGNFAECDVESLVSGVYIVRIFGEESSLPSVYRIVKE
ncbi:MAG: leucine-rich repeat protein [Bacteroidales bacterium]|nr:leucine-rich repeat protein [Bacteroidales bacterium]